MTSSLMNKPFRCIESPSLSLAQLRSDGLRIHDTRSGRTETHVLTDGERRALDAFDRPTAVGAVKSTAVVPDTDLLPIIQKLRAKGLLFIEGGRGISLVPDGPTPLPHFVELLRDGEVVLH